MNVCPRLATVLAAALSLIALLAQCVDAKPLVILLSLDGVRYDTLRHGDFPALKRIAREGLTADRLTAGWPSDTFPGHVTLATGTWADRHGIVDNEFLDNKRGLFRYSSDASWLMAEPLWIAAERQGVISATYFWVGSETDWHGMHQRYRVAPFDGSRSEVEKTDQILKWMSLPEAERPGLIMSYWHGTDAIAHRKGPFHPDTLAALQEQSTQIQRILDFLDKADRWHETTLMLVSDHGMTVADQTVDVAGLLADAGVAARCIAGGASMHIYLQRPQDLAKASTALAQIPTAEIYTPSTLPAGRRMLYPGRHGDLIVLVKPPVELRTPDWYEGLAYAVMGSCCDWHHGGHGYDPSLPDMGAWFLAVGRGVPSGGHVGEVKQIDVAPTVAHLLGIAAPAQSEGQPLSVISAALAAQEKRGQTPPITAL